MPGTGSTVIDDQVAQHGGLVGAPAKVDPTITKPGGQRVDNPNPHLRYTFADGTYLIAQPQTANDLSTLQITDGGTAVKPAATAQANGSDWTVVTRPDGTYRVNRVTGETQKVDDVPGTGTKTTPPRVIREPNTGTLYTEDPSGALIPQVQGQNAPKVVKLPDGSIGTEDATGTITVQVPAGATAVNAPATAKYILTRSADGSIAQSLNPNYDPQQWAGQKWKEQAAQAQQDYLNHKLDDAQYAAQLKAANDTITAQARADQVEVNQQKADAASKNADTAAQKADQTAQFQNATLAQTKAQNAFSNANTMETTGQQAGRDAVTAAQAGVVNRVGPGFGQDFSNSLAALSTGKGNVSFGPGDFSYQMPDYSKLSRDAAVSAIARLQAMNTPYTGPQAGTTTAPAAAPPNGTPAGFVAPTFSTSPIASYAGPDAGAVNLPINRIPIPPYTGPTTSPGPQLARPG